MQICKCKHNIYTWMGYVEVELGNMSTSSKGKIHHNHQAPTPCWLLSPVASCSSEASGWVHSSFPFIENNRSFWSCIPAKPSVASQCTFSSQGEHISFWQNFETITVIPRNHSRPFESTTGLSPNEGSRTTRWDQIRWWIGKLLDGHIRQRSSHGGTDSPWDIGRGYQEEGKSFDSHSGWICFFTWLHSCTVHVRIFLQKNDFISAKICQFLEGMGLIFKLRYSGCNFYKIELEK